MEQNSILYSSISSDVCNTYVTVTYHDCIKIFHDCVLFSEFCSDKNLTGVCYCKDRLYYTKLSNILYYTISNDSEEYQTVLQEYDTVKLLKQAGGTCGNALILMVEKDHNSDIIIYDLDTDEKFSVNFSYFQDAAVLHNNTAVVLGEETKNIGRYSDDYYDNVYTLIKLFNYQTNQILDLLQVVEYEVDSFNERMESKAKSLKYLKYPLDLYLMDYSDIISFSSDGTYILFYSEMMHAFMMTDIKGNLFRLFDSPVEREWMKDLKNVKCYYHEYSETLTVVYKNKIVQYLIKQSKSKIRELNTFYNDYYSKNKAILGRFSPFEHSLYRCLLDAKCKELARTDV